VQQEDREEEEEEGTPEEAGGALNELCLRTMFVPQGVDHWHQRCHYSSQMSASY
jgi:hypothetical protein